MKSFYVKEQADNKDELSSSYEKEVIANESELSSDDDSAPELDSPTRPHASPSRGIQVLPTDTVSVSSNSESDSDNRSDKKPRAVCTSSKREVEENLDQASKRQKKNQPTSAAASATQSTSVAHVDYEALVPIMSMNFGTEPFTNFMRGKFPIDVSNDAIAGFCYAYNFNEIQEKVFLGYEPFFGALKIYTIGVEKHMKYFQLLKDNQHTKAIVYMQPEFIERNKHYN
eukprot:scaffold37203_cov55-Attheya_sp.AAC.1